MPKYPTKRCSICDCPIDHRANKCVKCHNRTDRGTFEERFFKKINKTPHCWLWTGSDKKSGYGSITVDNGETMGAHRASWIYHYGSIPTGQWVLHNCFPLPDNRICVNPKHLWIGTPLDNVHDAMKKGVKHSPNGNPHTL